MISAALATKASNSRRIAGEWSFRLTSAKAHSPSPARAGSTSATLAAITPVSSSDFTLRQTEAVDIAVLADEITAEEAVANIQEGWEEITADFGEDEQLEIYRLSLGITN